LSPSLVPRPEDPPPSSPHPPAGGKLISRLGGLEDPAALSALILRREQEGPLNERFPWGSAKTRVLPGEALPSGFTGARANICKGKEKWSACQSEWHPVPREAGSKGVFPLTSFALRSERHGWLARWEPRRGPGWRGLLPAPACTPEGQNLGERRGFAPSLALLPQADTGS